MGNLGVAYAAMGNTQQALSCFRQALDWNPEYEQAHRNLGVLLAAFGSFKEAEQELNLALALDPNDQIASQLSNHLKLRSPDSR
jgi:Flp pilus assembly protein TadD